MELFTAAKDLKFLNAHQIIGEAMKIPAKSPSPLFLISTITFILPLSLAQLLCKISFSDFMLTLYPESIHDFSNILSLFLVSSLYIRHCIHGGFSLSIQVDFLYSHSLCDSSRRGLLLGHLPYLKSNFEEGALWWDYIIAIAVVCLGFLVHFYVMALWHLASVISVLEPNLYGLTAMKKSKELLQGRTKIALEHVKLYFAATWFIGKGFGYAMQLPVDCIMVKLLLGLLILFMLIAVNLTGFLVQSVFYFACKSHHNEMVDKKVLDDHLCGYVNYPSTGGVEVQSLVKGHEKVGYQPVAVDVTTDV
ncbi:hypothetical protein MKW98_005903 [Papaver atlanticum]|uniref:Uncharacterized protein n=1 Tax=Papaver atlanticum TaxID=357466 RepID=A0AAD4TDT2_9MAGN|nr:hypothetical protein MKW98_005903 [Papaver atlanticum]